VPQDETFKDTKGQEDRDIPKMGAIVSELAEYAIATCQHTVIKAAESGRSRLQERQLKKDLDHFWVRLGKTSFHLLEAGEIDHPALKKAASRINALEVELSQLRGD
jgi:hypothetical protein